MCSVSIAASKESTWIRSISENPLEKTAIQYRSAALKLFHQSQRQTEISLVIDSCREKRHFHPAPSFLNAEKREVATTMCSKVSLYPVLSCKNSLQFCDFRSLSTLVVWHSVHHYEFYSCEERKLSDSFSDQTNAFVRQPNLRVSHCLFLNYDSSDHFTIRIDNQFDSNLN